MRRKHVHHLRRGGPYFGQAAVYSVNAKLPLHLAGPLQVRIRDSHDLHRGQIPERPGMMIGNVSRPGQPHPKRFAHAQAIMHLLVSLQHSSVSQNISMLD